MIATFKSVRVHKSQFFIENDSGASFLADFFIAVFGLHVFPWEDALFKLKVDAVAREYFGEELAFDLFHELVDGIAEDEVALEGGMGVQIEVDAEP